MQPDSKHIYADLTPHKKRQLLNTSTSVLQYPNHYSPIQFLKCQK